MRSEGVPPSDPFAGLVGLVDVGRRYVNPPIVEATVDLRVSLPDVVGLPDLSDLYPDLEEAKPFFEFLPRFQEGTLVASGDQKGFRYGEVSDVVITAGLDRFAYSQLAQYEGWDQFIGGAEPRWRRYREATSPVGVTSVGVRYVNRIVINKPQVEINDYLRTNVDISPYLPQAIDRYFAQISFPITAFGVEATVTTSMVEAPVPDATALVLDIDVTRVTQLDPNSDSFSDELDEVFETLRGAKNYVFEACITDATRGVVDHGVHQAQPDA
ncbi:hypothetical protein B7435_24105 [Mycolicibacterium peregrinum]|uniref:TIGR04255 family protein n=1 Tax=Mycolicibacterium peregrinum TaxID=43304 RepID=UPI000B4BBAC5|nr:TIGR04255 family protein [Mycolicibacterium peregrinum]OWL98652.1 hypothetical protein B7435_24105 [Mycolicibacterium peregrinum]